MNRVITLGTDNIQVGDSVFFYKRNGWVSAIIDDEITVRWWNAPGEDIFPRKDFYPTRTFAIRYD